MKFKNNPPLLRWFVLITVTAHMLYAYLYDLIVKENTIPQVTEKYKSLFVPAPYTFAMWGLVFLGLLIYSIYQLLPPQRNKALYNEIALPLMISMTLGIWWGVTYHFELLTLSMISLVLMLVTAYMIYRKVHESVVDKESGKWLLVPFSLYFGWLTAANVAGLTVWLVYIQTRGSILGEINMTRILIFLTTVAAITVSAKYWDYVYSLVVGWALMGVYVARQVDDSPVGFAAFFCSIIMIVWSVIVISIKKNPSVDAQIR